MKLRIKGNSIRLRVSRSEVARLLADECLEETIYFAPAPDARLTYALEQEPSLTSPAVRYAEKRVVILIPADQASTWGVTNQVGISEIISLGALGSLELLVEKDFACLDRSEEENEDTFENPYAVGMCVPAR
jgi:hypothetical protein